MKTIAAIFALFILVIVLLASSGAQLFVDRINQASEKLMPKN